MALDLYGNDFFHVRGKGVENKKAAEQEEIEERRINPTASVPCFSGGVGIINHHRLSHACGAGSTGGQDVHENGTPFGRSVSKLFHNGNLLH